MRWLLVTAMLLGGCASFHEEHYFRAADRSGNTVNYFRVKVDIGPIFVAGQKSPGTDEVIKPLDPSTHGTLVMIFSSNPNSVADTIGQFAETQQVADAVTNIANRRTVQATRASHPATSTAPFTAAAAQLTSLSANLPDPTTATVAANKAQAAATCLATLRTIAISLGGDGKFATFDEANTWFTTHREATR